jgi:catechol 2,3-dioxygenase-like lactoylglutathione lyase family enzyme
MTLNTIFTWCNEIAAMRSFYTDVIGLEETYYNADHGWLTYQVGPTMLAFMTAPEPVPVIDQWAVTPTIGMGEVHAPSWVMELSVDEFQSRLDKIRDAGIIFHLLPDSMQARVMFVRDPMGTTIELFCPLPTL